MKYGVAYDLPISQAVIQQLAKGTIKTLIEAIVELVTNSDDSYRRLEGQGAQASGEIQIRVKRRKGGLCEELSVYDRAEGMDRGALARAIEFGGDSSGLSAGRTVRGLFGRGLKEAIISLGEGEVVSVKNDVADGVRIHWDKKERKARYQFWEEPLPATNELRSTWGIADGNGTHVRIKVSNEKIKCPDEKTLAPQITNHFALREINSSSLRRVKLFFEGECGRKYAMPYKSESLIRFSVPPGQQVLEKEVRLARSGDRIVVRVFETLEELEPLHNNPCSKAGLLIKTAGAVLDNRLFRFEHERAARYFFGEVRCDGIAERLRAGDLGIIDPNRAGMDWRDEYCQRLQSEVEKVIQALIDRKKRELETAEKSVPTEAVKKNLDKVCHLMNRLAKEVLEELEDIGDGGDVRRGEVNDLTVKPSYAYIKVEKPRGFSVYVPKGFIKTAESLSYVHAESDNDSISIIEQSILLGPYAKDESLLYGRFTVVGTAEGESGIIHCSMGEHEDIAQVIVGEPTKGRKKRSLVGHKGGVFSDIKFMIDENPSQRVYYERGTGVVSIFVRFPCVERYLGPGGKGLDTPAGSVMFAELMGEAFCKELARRAIDSGKYPQFPGAEVDAFNSAINDFQKKYLHRLHEIVVGR